MVRMYTSQGKALQANKTAVERPQGKSNVVEEEEEKQQQQQKTLWLMCDERRE